MTAPIVVFGMFLAAQAATAPVEKGHSENSLYLSVRSAGLSAGGARFALPGPRLVDGASAEVEREALRSIAGSERAASEFVRDSVAAPVVLKTRDERAGDAGVIRAADLWFVVHAGLEGLSESELSGGEMKEQTVEAGNMRFTTSPVAPGELEPGGARAGVRFVRLTGRLLDRIQVEAATDQIVATRSEGSWVIAAVTDPRFDGDRKRRTAGSPIDRKTGRGETSKGERYPGGVSYVKVSRLSSVPGALLLEGHFAFYEPKAWFDGAPILRSKIGLVAQDRVRSLRRELAQSRKGEGRRTTPGPPGD